MNDLPPSAAWSGLSSTTRERPQLSIQIHSKHSSESQSQSQSSYHSPLSYSSTPSPSIPALSRDSVISNSTTIQTPVPINTLSTQEYPFSFDSPHNKMTTSATAQQMSYADTCTYTNDSHSTPQAASHLHQPYHLGIEYTQETPTHNHYVAHPYDTSVLHGQHLGVQGWTPMISAFTINPQLMEPSPSRSLSPESNASYSPSTLATEEIPPTAPAPAPAPRMVITKSNASSASTTDEWYDGPSEWIRSVAESHKRRRESYLASPKAWPKGEGEPKELQPLTDHCRFPHLWEVEQARRDLTEDAVVAKLMKKSETTIAKEFARCQKAGEEFKPPRPMNSAMAFADFRRPQWGDMYSDMKTGSISTWLSAEWRALKDLRPEEFEWWTRVSKKYWDKYVEDYDYKFTRAPNGEGKGSKKRKAKAKENAAREKAIRLSNEAARRNSRRSTSTRGSLAPPMNIVLPDQQHQQHHNQYQPFGSPNVLGLTGIPTHHLTPTTLTPTHNGQLTYATGYFDGYTFPLTEGSQTPSPPQLLTPLEAPHSSHGHHGHSQSPGPSPYAQAYYYPTQAQMNYAHQQAQAQQQQQLHHQHQQQLQLNICNSGPSTYYQPPFQPQAAAHEYYTHQTPTQGNGSGGHIATLAPHTVPSPQ
ncbi:hypothetical protein I302_107800 [Kwoniella bestiolae CBS 10118]|uniref:HMG box domain-containing protein n=1 Tax=Kwoniella bestiolae CBS 10118 TaxID=1296100 RepID=A0A1B9FXH1_9TREE|nr:hypothetical protein I302_06460 [Kwoniella bestiolae CBS 10118]OCF23478.1 hypothetical protein I302_06460 [Kwoniella bestiolae CBS 10118]